MLQIWMRPTVVITFVIVAMLPTRTSATTEINYDGKRYGLLSGDSATGTEPKCQENYPCASRMYVGARHTRGIPGYPSDARVVEFEGERK